MLTWVPWLWAWTLETGITVDRFRQMLPLFADVEKYPDWMIEAQIDAAKCYFNPCVWGCKLLLGEAYWIANNLLLGQMLENQPMISSSSYATSKRVGDTSISYSQNVVQNITNPNYWTRYGLLYQQLLESLPGGIGLMVV